jgi:hypothetical protein
LPQRRDPTSVPTEEFQEAVSAIHRGVLGVLTAVLGMAAYGVAIRAMNGGDYVVGFVAGAGALAALMFILFLFAEGLRENW